MEKLINTMPAILNAAGAADEVAEAASLAAWKHAVGETLSSHAIALSLVDRVLTVAVADRVWQRQLQQMHGHLLYRLNSVLGQTLVNAIEFRVDENRFKPIVEARSDETSQQLSRPIPIELLSAAASIDDPDLRKAFLGAALSCVHRNEQV
jgi:hypothetical protein